MFPCSIFCTCYTSDLTLPDRRLPKIYLERGVGLTQRQGFLNCSASVRQACAFSVISMDWRLHSNDSTLTRRAVTHLAGIPENRRETLEGRVAIAAHV